jgi:hypothetical protein
MRSNRLATLLLVLPLAVACTFVKPQVRVPSDTTPSTSAGYVGGLFAKDTMVGFGFVVRDEKSQDEYVLELKDKELGVIAVPAGRYRVSAWVTWALTTERLTRKEIPANVPLGRAFDLRPGQVMLLGSWSADRHMGFASNTYTIAAKPLSEAEAVKAFKAAYPGLADSKVACLACLAGRR